ncbi:class I SAM-dependent methyltransferase [Mycobacterium branderi]|uniref:S-adenosyl-L-methionine-dependent methyltransferase n=1 Tax=Mycobacterium branderi TaxID=43348 RepID=A0A7I7W7R4_9MYCO|nr:SAM-dependent methyltransferase [Mycobacterium branderi]MCV7231566.1 SAM-dependent methyltransferase [Mycobacterium branderi]ORA37365.1 SAM-dependent methyltransferase [Mycobacterium branderi]BBZ13629.1 S-adenosyl-L-methionine-dependent methyltransferase [Mycobacterium branderi]
MAGRRLDRKASLTAQINAAQRAAEALQPPGRRLLDDPYSRHFVRHPALRAMLAHRALAGAALRVFDRRWGGLHAHIVLRVRYADAVCEAAIRDGIDQIVLLGAGFDTTSLRNAAAPVTIFEVDAPTTQKDKRPVTEQLLPVASHAQIVWVPCDFEENVLQKRLIGSGFDPARPSVVVWLGVSPYLTGQAIDTTLGDLASLCAPGSRLVVDYIDADVITARPRWKSARRVAHLVARRGEPYRSGFTAAELDALLAAHGFKGADHATVSLLLRRYDPAHARGLSGDDWLGIATGHRI